MFDDGYIEYCRLITANGNVEGKPAPKSSISGCQEFLDVNSKTQKTVTENHQRSDHQNSLQVEPAKVVKC